MKNVTNKGRPNKGGWQAM